MERVLLECCCHCSCSCVITTVTALVIWLCVSVSIPKFSVQEFYLPALNKTANSTSNTTLYFKLQLDNGNIDKGIYYEALNLTFYYGPNRSHLIGNAMFPAFYQGNNKVTARRKVLETHDVPWEAVLREVSNRTVVFKVDLATALRFKTVFGSKIKRKRLVVGSIIKVNDSGKKVKKKGIKLKSGASKLDCYLALGSSLVVLLVCLF